MSVRITNWNMDEFKRIRTTPEMAAHLAQRGAEWVSRLNDDLHQAQAARKQPVEDGYDYNVSTGGTRARLYVTAVTARAMAHEARHQSMLKMMPVGDVKHPVDPNLPRELAKRSNEAKNADAQGNPIHKL